MPLSGRQGRARTGSGRGCPMSPCFLGDVTFLAHRPIVTRLPVIHQGGVWVAPGGSSTPSCGSYHPGEFGDLYFTVALCSGRRAGARGAAERMGAVLHLAAHGLRAHWRSWVVLALLVALAGGAVLAAVAGARRTDSAYPRFLQVSNGSDVLVSPGGTGLGGYYRALARLPGVAAVAPLAALNTLAPGQVMAPADHRLQHGVDTPRVLAGRLPLPDRPGEIAVDQHGAAVLHLHVGSTLAMHAVRSDGPPTPASTRALRERVVGIMVTRSSVKPVTAIDKIPMILASTALMRDLGPSYLAADGAAVKLKRGTTVDTFRRRAEALARRFPGTQPQGGLLVADEGMQAATVQRAIRPEAVALALFAMVLAVVAFLVTGQVATRLLAASSADNPALVALGATRAQLSAPA